MSIHLPPMPALTVWQPHASLIAYEAKLYETRSWATNYRGPIANHAAAKDPSQIIEKLTAEQEEAMCMALEDYAMIGDRTHKDLSDHCVELPRGCIISTGILTDCKWVKGTRLRGDGTAEILFMDGSLDRVPEQELLFGDFTPGRFAWRIRNTEMLPKPIPAKGHQRLWMWEGAA